MHSNRASAKVPQRAPRIKKSTVHFRRQRVPRGRERFRPPCRGREPGRPLGRPAAGRPWEARTWTPYIATADVLRMYEKNEKGRHLPSALYKSAARPARHRQAPAPAARLRHGFAAVCAALAPLLCPAPAQAGDDYDALILRARRRPPTGAGHAARPGSGRRPARHPGPHPGGQLGGPARRGDADLRATARRRAAARRRSVGGGARCATCAAGRKRWRSSAPACAPIRPSPPSPPASP